jgi:hypothetical protein
LTSYLMNGAVCGYGSTRYGLALRRFAVDAVCFWEPSEERPGVTGAPWNDGSSYPSEGLTTRHGSGAGDGGCVGLFGGSAKWMPRVDYNRLKTHADDPATPAVNESTMRNRL